MLLSLEQCILAFFLFDNFVLNYSMQKKFFAIDLIINIILKELLTNIFFNHEHLCRQPEF